MKEIFLTKGAVAIVDDEDAWALDYKWYLHGVPGYAARNTRKTLGRLTYIHVEVLVLKLGHRDFVLADHIDRNPMNNTRDNLRPADHKLNAQNRVWKSPPGHKNRRLPDALPRACGYCGVEFTPIRKKREAKFCSRDCSAKKNLVTTSEVQSRRGKMRHREVV